MCPEVSGSVWEGTGRVPELPGARFRFRPNFGYEEGPGGVNFVVLKPKRDFEGWLMPTRSMASFLRRWGHHGCLLLQWHGLLRRHRRVHRSAFARDHAWHGVAAICRSHANDMLSKLPQRLAAGSTPACADAPRGLLHDGRDLLPYHTPQQVRRRRQHWILPPGCQLCAA